MQGMFRVDFTPHEQIIPGGHSKSLDQSNEVLTGFGRALATWSLAGSLIECLIFKFKVWI